MNLKKLLKIFISWRLLILLSAFIAISRIPFKPSFPYSQAILQPLGAPILHRWGNFDGVHYLTIINKGYVGTGSIQAFFPVYPSITRFLSSLFNNPLIAGLTISHLSFFASLWLLYKLIILDENKQVAIKSLLLLIAFPTSFFFAALYTESFFLLLILLVFYLARKKRWWLAGIIGAIAAATRFVGIFIVPALLLEWWQQTNKKNRLKNIDQTLAALLPSTGLFLFMRYLQKTFQDALLFVHVQSSFGAGRQSDRLILLYQVFWRYIKMIFTVSKNTLLFYTVSMEFLSGLVFLILIIAAFYMTRKSYALFAALAYLAPTLTGTFSSMPRYVLVLFPAFIILAKIIKSKPLFYLITTLFGILQLINTALFIQGYWIA